MMPPAAMSPEANSEPARYVAFWSEPPAFFTAESTSQRTTPPVKMASVVPMERYAPTAKESERTPSSSTPMTRKTPSMTSPQGSFLLRIPLMTVAMRRAWGAAAFSLPMPGIHCTSMRPVVGE